MCLIDYSPLWVTMKHKQITQYDLYTRYGISRSLLDKLRHNRNIEVLTIDRLCSILNCRVEEVMRYVPDDNDKN